jgi:phytoene dehydrogenase-like protein
MNKTAIIIGSGVGGLAAAIRLAVQGFQVQVFEANDYAGGKLSEVSASGYRFDAGPSLFTMPENVEALFELAGKDIHEYFSYHRLEELCRYWYADGVQFTAWADNDKFAQEAAAATGESPETIKNYLAASARKYHIVGELFMHRSMSDWRTYFNAKALAAYPKIPSLGLFSTMASYHANTFKTPHIQQYFNRYATYNGSDPWQVPALLSVIPHLEHGKGAFFPIPTR